MHNMRANITSILKRQPLSCDMWATLVIRNGLSSRDDPIGQVGEKAAQVGLRHCGHAPESCYLRGVISSDENYAIVR